MSIQKRNTLSLLAAIIMLLSAVGAFTGLTARAATMAYFEDLEDVLTEDEESAVKELLVEAAQASQVSVGLTFVTSLGDKTPRQYCEDLYDRVFGADTDGILLLVSADGDYISAEGEGLSRFGKDYDKILTECYEGLDRSGFYGMAESYCNYIIEKSTGKAPATSTETGGHKFKAALEDYDGVLTSSEISSLKEYMLDTADIIECNVGVVITDDLGGKSDERYADDFLDSNFGFGSNSIVLLFNNDRSNMDYTDMISACGKGSDAFDRYADRIYDMVYDGLGDDNYYAGIIGFCEALKKYNNNAGASVVDPVTNVVDIISLLFIPSIIALVIALFVTVGVASTYSKKAPVSAGVYLEQQRTKFKVRNDIFVREFTTHHRVSDSSGGSGGRHGGGGGHHSSSHHSHSHSGGRRR